LPSFEEVLTDIFDSQQPLVDARLARLSNLTSEQLNLFKKMWTGADSKRQYQIIHRLAQLSEENLEMDFDSIFGFCLYESDKKIRFEAVSGLEGTEDRRFVAPLIHLLKEDTAEEVRAAAAVILGNFALLAETGELPTKYGDDVYSALRDQLINKIESVEVRRHALEAIAVFSFPEVANFIDKSYSSNDIKLKASALYAMGRNCNPEWLPILIKELANSQAEIRYEAATACGELEEEEAVPYLINLLEDEDAEVQEAVIRALGKIGGQEAKESLEALLRHPEERVRQAAEAALQELFFWEEPLSFRF